MHRETRLPEEEPRVVIMLNLHLLINSTKSSTLVLRPTSSLFAFL